MSTELPPRDGVLFEFAAGPTFDRVADTLIELGRTSLADSVSVHRDESHHRLACYVWSGEEAGLRDATRRLQPFALGTIDVVRLKGGKRVAGGPLGAPTPLHFVGGGDMGQRLG